MNISVKVTLIAFLCLSANIAHSACNGTIAISTPNSNFTDHGNGTVTHIPTKLMWSKCTEGLSGELCESGSIQEFSWGEALDAAEQSQLANHTDWRLPNIKELSSILESSCYRPAINKSIFPNTPYRPFSDSGTEFWSSTPSVENGHNAWVVSFLFGQTDHWRKDLSINVRLVRDAE